MTERSEPRASLFHHRLRRWEVQWFGWRRGWPHFGVYLTGWFYFTNHSYPTEPRCFIRIGNWRRDFGGIRAYRGATDAR